MLDQDMDDRQAEKFFSRAHRHEVAAYAGFAKYLFKKCETEFNQPLFRKFYYYTRQAQRNGRRFAKSPGEALFDWAAGSMGPGSRAFPSQFVTAYELDSFDGVISVSLYNMKTSWDLNTRVFDKYEKWEIRQVGVTEDIQTYN